MSGGWVYATHPETGGETRFPDDPAVIEAQEARGWICGGDLPPHLDPEARDLAPVATAAEEPPAVEPADETPTPSEKSTTSSKTKRTPAGSAGDDTNGAASA